MIDTQLWMAKIFGKKVIGVDTTDNNITYVLGYKYRGILYITAIEKTMVYK